MANTARNSFSISALLLLSLMISACGWHLRGVTALPKAMQLITLSSQASASFSERLQQQLEFNGSVIFSGEKSEQPLTHLSIGGINIERRTLSVNSLGQAAEYELEARLEVNVITALQDYKWQLTVRRTLTNDANNVVASQSEQRIQIQDIEQQLASQLMRRLQKIK